MKQDLTRILTETMQLIDGCLPSTGELLPLREAATMIIFRLLLIHETHRQGILFRRDPESCESLALFHEITLAIREGGSDRIAIVGPSIFGNSLPTRIDPETTAYLDAFDLACVNGLPLEAGQRWDALVLRVGIFAVEVTSATGNLHHRALGDVYEQILGLTPRRDKDGSCSLDDGDSKSTRRKLGAHYTPHELVEEIVRPALGHMFEQLWNEVDGDLSQYTQRISTLQVLDPAMGSAHFLTVTALEIAREAAWVELNGTHRPFDWHEPLTHTNPIGKDVDDHKGEARYDGGEGTPLEFQQAIQRRLPAIVRQCIHGVDLNPFAAELGKLALWLFTMSELSGAEGIGAPTLSFLDANIRCGDSLVGLSWDEVTETLTGRLGFSTPTKGRGQPRLSFGSTCDGILSDVESRPRSKMKWLHDLTLLARYHDYSTRKKKGFQAFAAALGLSEAASHDEIKSTITTLLDTPFNEHVGEFRKFLDTIEDSAHKLRTFHWELEFAHVFNPRGKGKKYSTEKTGFDVVVANPPFVGDTKLRKHFGSEYLIYITSSLSRGNNADLSGLFFLKYDNLLNVQGIAASIAPNTICQSRNRRVVLEPLLLKQNSHSKFYIKRAEQSERWPGDANVFISKILLSRKPSEEVKLITLKSVRKISGSISSYLDSYPDFKWKSLPSVSRGLVYNGMKFRGQFFLHINPNISLIQSIKDVPQKERSSIKAYVNSLEIQQTPRISPTRIAIDFTSDMLNENVFEQSPLEQLVWLEKNRPYLLKQLRVVNPFSKEKVSVEEFRKSLNNSSFNLHSKQVWWIFQNTRLKLRKRLENITHYMVFGRVVKIWSPSYLTKVDDSTALPICPSEQLFISPIQSKAFFGVISSFFFEAFMRREVSSLETTTRTNPTDTFPFFPMPWKPTWDDAEGRPFITQVPEAMEADLGKVVDELLSHRQAILDDPKGYRVEKVPSNWGPTKLYNLYDDEKVTLPGIQKLRELHVELLHRVLCAYGWDGVAAKMTWGFERPWIDRTQRYIPDFDTRRAMFGRLTKLNAERYQYEIGLFLENILGDIPERGGVTKAKLHKVIKARGVDISSDDLEAVLAKGINARTLEIKGKRYQRLIV